MFSRAVRIALGLHGANPKNCPLPPRPFSNIKPVKPPEAAYGDLRQDFEPDAPDPKKAEAVARMRSHCLYCSRAWTRTEFAMRALRFRRLNPPRFRRRRRENAPLNHLEIDHLMAFFRIDGSMTQLCRPHVREYAAISKNTVRHLGLRARGLIADAPPVPHVAGGPARKPGPTPNSTEAARPRLFGLLAAWIPNVCRPLAPSPGQDLTGPIVPLALARTRRALYLRFCDYVHESFKEKPVCYATFWRMIQGHWPGLVFESS